MNQILVVRNKLHKKLLVSAIKTLLEYYEITGKTEGCIREIADIVRKARGTVSRYLWELHRQGLVGQDGRKYKFNPETLSQTLEKLGVAKIVKPPKPTPEMLEEEEVAKKILALEKKVKELEEKLKHIKPRKEERKDKKQCRLDKLVKELDEWSKSMDEWADTVDQRLDDLEQRMKNLTSLVLRLLDRVGGK